MEYSSATVGGMQLDEYVAEIAGVYKWQDNNRSIWDVWCHALHHGAAIVERIRRKAPAADLTREIADFALWLFTVVHKLRGQVGESRGGPSETNVEPFIRIANSCSNLLWHKYPRICPSCYARRSADKRAPEKSAEFRKPCDCVAHPDHSQDKESRMRTIIALRGLSEAAAGEKPMSIDEWQEMFGVIFSASLKHFSLEEVAAHLMEELGEVSDAMVRMYSYKAEIRHGEPSRRQLRLESQLADLFSWLFG
jgi:hypothetical protein